MAEAAMFLLQKAPVEAPKPDVVPEPEAATATYDDNTGALINEEAVQQDYSEFY